MADNSLGKGWLRPMTAADLESVLALRNHVEIRRYGERQLSCPVDDNYLGR